MEVPERLLNESSLKHLVKSLVRRCYPTQQWDGVGDKHKLVCENSEDCDDRKVLETDPEPACRDMKS